tara:strand:+ start:322 stop:657 length:336 start_codon:yes stop_codon:yes gene_type:complete
MKYDKNMDNYKVDTRWDSRGMGYSEFIDHQNELTREEVKEEVKNKYNNKIDELENKIQSYKHDLKVCEDEDLKLRDMIDKHLKFNYKHRYIIKALKFIDKIKFPRIKIDWK